MFSAGDEDRYLDLRNCHSSEEDIHKEVRDALELPKFPNLKYPEFTLHKYIRNRLLENESDFGSPKVSQLDLFKQLSASEQTKNKKKKCKPKCCKKKEALLFADSGSEDELDHLEMKLNVFFARE